MHKTKAIIFVWILSHIGIKGEDRMNSAAKSTSGMVIDNYYKLPYTDKKKRLWWTNKSEGNGNK